MHNRGLGFVAVISGHVGWVDEWRRLQEAKRSLKFCWKRVWVAGKRTETRPPYLGPFRPSSLFAQVEIQT